jgi:hypothetical protein
MTELLACDENTVAQEVDDDKIEAITVNIEDLIPLAD